MLQLALSSYEWVACVYTCKYVYMLLCTNEYFYMYLQYLPAEISRLEIHTWWDYRPWLWPRALLKQPRENAPSIPEVIETPR